MSRDLDTPDAAGLTLRERLDDLRAWAERRIQQCRRDEAKLALPSSLEAAAERRALAAVLEQLGWPVPARDERTLRELAQAAAARRERRR